MLGPVIHTPLLDRMSIQLQFTLGNTVSQCIDSLVPVHYTVYHYFIIVVHILINWEKNTISATNAVQTHL
jgi:hypothetical protein